MITREQEFLWEQILFQYEIHIDSSESRIVCMRIHNAKNARTPQRSYVRRKEVLKDASFLF
jgi:hypothetical protein